MIELRHRRVILAILILWLAFGLRLYQLDFQSIWWDEGHSIFVASHPIPQIPTLPAMDVHPPAYFALLNLWTNVTGSSEFALRYLSVIFSLLTVALLWRFGTALSGRHSYTPILAAFFAAISPLYVAYAQEVRSYAMITFLALVSTYLLWEVIRGQGSGVRSQEKEGTRQWVIWGGYVVATAACLYTHYFTIFLLLFQNVVWLIWAIFPRHNVPFGYSPLATRHSLLATRHSSFVTRHSLTTHKLKLWLTTQLGILVLFLPQLMLATRQITSYTNPNLVAPDISFFISRSWQAYTVGLTLNPTPARWSALAIAAILVITWTIVLLNKSRFRNSQLATRNFLFLSAWVLVPLAAYYLILLRQPSFEPRYLILVTPAIFLLLALGLNDFGFTILDYSPRNEVEWDLRLRQSDTRHSSLVTYYALRITFYVLTLSTIAILLFGLYNYYTNQTFFKDDSAGVANWLAAKTTPNDIVFVDVPHPFHYYAARQNIPAPTRYLFVDIHTAADTLDREAAGRDRLYWVTWWGSDTDPRGVIPFLAEKAGQPGGQQDFKGYHLEWFNLPPDAAFSLPNTLAPANATFGDVLRLDGFAVSEQIPPGEPAWATLHFTLLRESDIDYKVSLRLRDENGQVVGQIDRDLLNDRHFRTSAWPLNDPLLNQATNVYLLPLPTDVAPGSYQLEAVVYNAQPPYPSEGVTGHDTTDGVATIIGRVTIAP